MISPSLIDQYLGCARKAAFKYWGEDYGVPRPDQGKAAGLGSELHDDCAEPYLTYGKVPDQLTQAGELFIAGLPFLPAPRSGGVEGEFVLTVAGISYTGKIDYRGPLPNFGCVDNDPRTGEAVSRVVLDHKTSSNPKEYGLWGREAFLRDPQAIIYAARDMVEAKKQNLPEADLSRLRWLYYPTKGRPKALPSDAMITRSEVEDAFGKLIHPVAVTLVQLQKTRPNPLTLEPNTSQCAKYRTREQRELGRMGCAFHCSNGGPCAPTDDEMFAGAARQLQEIKPQMDLLAMLKNKDAAQAATPTNTGATATPRDVINPPEAQATATSGVRPSAPAAGVKDPSIPATPTAPRSGDLAYALRVLCAELGAALVRASERM